MVLGIPPPLQLCPSSVLVFGLGCALAVRHRKKGGVVLQKNKINGAGWLTRLPCSSFLERAIKNVILDNFEIWPFWDEIGPFRGMLGPKSPLFVAISPV
jgi:hypothetical protein